MKRKIVLALLAGALASPAVAGCYDHPGGGRTCRDPVTGLYSNWPPPAAPMVVSREDDEREGPTFYADGTMQQDLGGGVVLRQRHPRDTGGVLGWRQGR